ncbi:FCD domain-containing protein [Pseudonocardia broussonetiae]|uniref:FCD domain-containing protein n=1 Tax=Pseudonocardia broussonetiae TaxID=2736640 RepID=A0A6M6JDT6_9PSEU|nr:FCD domain-containing protein [Pseudonocardia broussonetiae]QJY46088.1 FCD domain-containing protein [Pseudonocardia broussonetiae]
MARASSGSDTRAGAVLRRLRGDILNGRLAPGSKLGFAELGERYEVSTGVLREVLPRLVEQGLATSEAQLGFRVVDVSVDKLMQLTDARVVLESIVIRDAIATGDIAWESEVVARHHTLERVGRTVTGDEVSDAWHAAHEAFHLAILAGCGNSYLYGAAARLRSISVVYRCWSTAEHRRTHRDVEGEHRAIMQATIGRDADLAVRLGERHIRLTTELLIASRPAAAPV